MKKTRKLKNRITGPRNFWHWQFLNFEILVVRNFDLHPFKCVSRTLFLYPLSPFSILLSARHTPSLRCHVLDPVPSVQFYPPHSSRLTFSTLLFLITCFHHWLPLLKFFPFKIFPCRLSQILIPDSTFQPPFSFSPWSSKVNKK